MKLPLMIPVIASFLLTLSCSLPNQNTSSLAEGKIVKHKRGTLAIGQALSFDEMQFTYSQELSQSEGKPLFRDKELSGSDFEYTTENEDGIGDEFYCAIEVLVPMKLGDRLVFDGKGGHYYIVTDLQSPKKTDRSKLNNLIDLRDRTAQAGASTAELEKLIADEEARIVAIDAKSKEYLIIKLNNYKFNLGYPNRSTTGTPANFQLVCRIGEHVAHRTDGKSKIIDLKKAIYDQVANADFPISLFN